jgi:hypothetical protein
MPIIGDFNSDLKSTDLIFGLGDGILSMYKLYDGKVPIDKNNQGRNYAPTERKLESFKKISVADAKSKKDPQTRFTTEGLAKNREYLDALESGQIPKKYAESAPFDGEAKAKEKFASRRKCKSILHWQLIIKQLRVQFVVTGMDLARVPTKEIVTAQGPTQKYSSVPASKEEYGITDAELRWVFRNRNNRLVEQNLQFWNSTPPVPCAAPWNMTEYKDAWAKYDLSITRKLFDIKVVGSGPNDPLVFDYDLRSAGTPLEVVSGKTDAEGHAAAKWMPDCEIRFRGFGSFGRVETQWQSILPSRYMNLQFGRYRFICERRDA